VTRETIMAGTYPHVRVSGGPRERGRQYGRAAADRVARSVEIYRRIFAHYADWTWSRVTAHAREYIVPIEAAHPRYLEEIRGIAEGAGLEADDVLALNVRTEVMFAAVARLAARECTSFAALPGATADGHPLIGQNWDWKPRMTGTVVILEAEQDEGPSFVTVVEAGLLAKTGMNAAGIGLATNALVSDRDVGEPGIPYHVVLRAILDARNLPDVLDAVTRHRRSSAANYLVMSHEGMAVDIEAAPGDHSQVWLTWPKDDVLVHANHFVCDTGLKDVMRWRSPDSPFRLERATRRLGADRGSIDAASLQALLRDHANHPAGVCTHPDPRLPELERDMSVASVIWDLEDRTLWLADGQPCEVEYRRIDYAGFLGERAPSA
jgi:isopenicillin-N N-acyltransferase like protein